MHYEGKIYRPWIEANSLLIQTTLGCTNNKCTFCDMFRDKKFRIREIDGVFEDIEEARTMFHHIESIFLVDGNVMAVKTDYLLKILDKITTTFPECSKISLYAGFNDLRRKSSDELKELKKAGLSKAYIGLESGDRTILERIKKGLTQEQALEGAKKAKQAGIDMLVSVIFGLGGKELSSQHIIETTRLLNLIKPEEIAPMALTIQPGTQLAKEVKSGEFLQATPLQILEEEKYLLENLKGFDTFYWGDHGNNVVSSKGKLPDNRSRFLGRIEHAIAHNPVTKQEILTTMPW